MYCDTVKLTQLHAQLSSLPNEIRKYSNDVAEFVDKHVDQIAETLRDTLANSPWIPEQFRPQAPPPPPIIAVPASALEKVQNWIARHKILVGFVVLASGAIAYRTYRSSALWRKKRRARRARSGGRVEVVVIAGSPALPLTRSLSLDLERKGFIVFIVSNSHEDEMMVQNLARPDIRPLSIDITDVRPSLLVIYHTGSNISHSPQAPATRSTTSRAISSPRTPLSRTASVITSPLMPSS